MRRLCLVHALLVSIASPAGRAAFSAAESLAPDDPDLRIDRARAARADCDAASADLDRALALDPTRTDAPIYRVAAWRHIRHRRGNRERALEDVELALDPGAVGGLIERGILHRLTGNAAAGTPAVEAARRNLERPDVKVD